MKLQLRTILLILFCVVTVLFPALALSDCADLSRATSWYVQGANRVIFYSGLRPIAYVDIPYCALSPTSSINLITSYVCESDRIIIDGVECIILSVYKTGTMPAY
jgi:hypothetical protein